MPLTTTESIGVSQVLCGECGKPARGGVLIERLGLCHVRASDRDLLLAMIGDAQDAKPAARGPRLDLGFALDIRGFIVPKSALRWNPRPPVANVDEFIDEVVEPRDEEAPRPAPDMTAPPLPPAWAGGKEIGEARGVGRPGGLG